MSERLYVKHPLFPMAGIAVSVFIFAFGLAMAKSPGVFFFLGGIWLLLALSVETRGFTTEATPYTVYRPVYLQAKDGAFAALSALCAMGAVLL